MLDHRVIVALILIVLILIFRKYDMVTEGFSKIKNLTNEQEVNPWKILTDVATTEEKKVALKSSNLTLLQKMKILSTHNNLRKDHGAGPLAWDLKLEEEAKNWVQNPLAETQVHPINRKYSTEANDNYGQNYSGYVNDVIKATNQWYNEKYIYSLESVPYGIAQMNAGKKPTKDVFHFTQVVWKPTTKIGCAFKRTGNNKGLYCNYHVAGNVGGKLIETTKSDDSSSTKFDTTPASIISSFNDNVQI